MSTALGFAKESYLKKKARLNHPPHSMDQAEQHLVISAEVPGDFTQASGSGATEVEVST